MTDAPDSGLVAVAGHRFAGSECEAAHVVEAVEMIGVGVSEQDRVEMADVLAQNLGAQIGRRVDEHGFVTWRVRLNGGNTHRLDLRYKVAKRKNVDGL